MGACKRLGAVALALAVFALGAAATLGAYHARIERDPVMAYPSVDEVSNFDTMLRSYRARCEDGTNPVLVFGSSELNPAPAGPAHPASLLEGGRYGVDVMVTGRAFCEDLWQAIEVGAFAGELETKRVVIIPSMQWFMCYRTPGRDFPAAFSEGAYQAFMENGAISRSTKDAVTARMAAYGVDRRGGSGGLASAASALDADAAELKASLRLAVGPDGVGAADDAAPASAPASRPGAPAGIAAPDWDAIFAEARETARDRSSSNDLGIYDRWFEKSYAKWLKGASGWRVEDGEYFSEQEFQDFNLLLQVCREAGVEPMVLIQPVKGRLYDQTLYTRDVRARYYQRIREACRAAGVPYADFSPHEYDALFLREYSHPSDLGGAYYSKAIFRYVTDGVVDTEPAGGVSFESCED